MLVLSRRVGESVVIDENITVTVVKSTGNRIKIAIEAPPEVPIKRSELTLRSEEQSSMLRSA